MEKKAQLLEAALVQKGTVWSPRGRGNGKGKDNQEEQTEIKPWHQMRNVSDVGPKITGNGIAPKDPQQEIGKLNRMITEEEGEDFNSTQDKYIKMFTTLLNKPSKPTHHRPNLWEWLKWKNGTTEGDRTPRILAPGSLWSDCVLRAERSLF